MLARVAHSAGAEDAERGSSLPGEKGYKSLHGEVSARRNLRQEPSDRGYQCPPFDSHDLRRAANIEQRGYSPRRYTAEVRTARLAVAPVGEDDESALSRNPDHLLRDAPRFGFIGHLEEHRRLEDQVEGFITEVHPPRIAHHY